MPKQSSHKDSFYVQAGFFHYWDDLPLGRFYNTISIDSDHAEFVKQIERLRAFSYRGNHGVITVRADVTKHGMYWYAYKRDGDRVYKKYVGKSSDVTTFKLIEVYSKLIHGDLV